MVRTRTLGKEAPNPNHQHQKLKTQTPNLVKSESTVPEPEPKIQKWSNANVANVESKPTIANADECTRWTTRWIVWGEPCQRCRTMGNWPKSRHCVWLTITFRRWPACWAKAQRSTPRLSHAPIFPRLIYQWRPRTYRWHRRRRSKPLQTYFLIRSLRMEISMRHWAGEFYSPVHWAIKAFSRMNLEINTRSIGVNSNFILITDAILRIYNALNGFGCFLLNVQYFDYLHDFLL